MSVQAEQGRHARPTRGRLWLGVSACAFVLLAGCESPGHDDLDALDDTMGAIDVVQANNNDAFVNPDTGADVGGSGIDWTGPGKVVDIGVFAKAVAQWECQRIVDCGCVSTTSAPVDVATCIGQLTPAIAAKWSNGGLGVREDLVPLCIDALEAQSATCDVTKIETTLPCRAALRWPGKEGGACGAFGTFLCADGSVCEKGMCSAAHLSQMALGQPCVSPLSCGDAACVKGSSGKSTCAVRAAPGGSCHVTADCLPPATCQTPTGATAGTCVLPAAKGAACSVTTDCAPALACVGGVCTAPTTCSPGSTCGNNGRCLGTVQNKCAARLKVGGTCANDSQCADTTYCAAATHTCTALPTQGAPCGNGSACAAGLGCDVDAQTCQPLPTQGHKCALGAEGPFLCAPGLACTAATLLCDTPPVENQPCANPHTCSDADIDGDGKGGDLACNFTFKGSLCMKKLGEGVTCETDACQSGLFCDVIAGKCVKTVALGATCKTAKDCGPGNACVPNAANKLICAPLPKLGGACLDTCAAGLYCQQAPQVSACQPPVCGDL